MKQLNYLQLFDRTNSKKYLAKIQNKYGFDNKKMSQILKLDQDWYTRYMDDTYEDTSDEKLNHIKEILAAKNYDIEVDYWWRDVFEMYKNISILKENEFIIQDLEEYFNCKVDVEESELIKNTLIVKLKK